MKLKGVELGELLFTCIVIVRGDWSPWSSCSKSCDVGVQSRSKSVGGEIRREEQYCNLEYCPGIGKVCSGDCYGFGGRAACINSECICSMGSYYNKYNCYPEVGNCIIRENPPFSPVHVEADSLKYGYRLRGCVTNDNPENEVHMIGIYGDRHYNTYDVVIRPRGESKKPIILVLSSYHVTNWRIDTTVHLDSIIYGSLRKSSYPRVKILENSKCGSSNIIQWHDIASAYGSDTGGGNTVKALLELARYYGPVMSFTGVYVLYSPKRFTLEVGGNSLQNRNLSRSEYVNTKECTKVSQRFSIMTTTVSPTNTSGLGTEWTSWSSCSKSCDVGVQSRSKSDCGEIRREEQYCNLGYCPGIGEVCSGHCYRFEGRAACINSECICSMGSYYNKYNCYPEVGNCIIRKNPPFSPVHVEADSLKYGYRLRGCVTNDNPENEVHMIGIYGDKYSNSYDVVIRPRGESKKPIILVLSSYHVTNWRIDTTVHLDSIIYGSLRESSYPHVKILENSKCGSSNIIQWHDIASAYGSDTGGGNTVKALLELARYYGPVMSFTGVYVLYSPKRFTLEVGGNSLQNRNSSKSEYFNTKECTKVSQRYFNMTTTVSPTTTQENMALSLKTNALIPGLAAGSTLVFVLVCFFCYWKIKRKRSRHSATSQTNVMAPVEYQARSFYNYDMANRNWTSQSTDQQRISNPDILADISTPQLQSYPTPTSLSSPPPPYSSCGLRSPQSRTEAPPTATRVSSFNSNNTGNSLHTTSESTSPVTAASASLEHLTPPTSLDLPPSYSSCVQGYSDLPPSYDSI